MKRALTTVFAVLLVQVGQAQQVQSSLASIGGIVLQADSGEPLPNAQVTLTKVMTPQLSGVASGTNRPPVIPSVNSDVAGRFSFDRLEPGVYRLGAARNGFVRETYGARVPGGTGTTLVLSAGQTLKDLRLRLVKAAAVAGRVRYDSGEPAAALGVELLKSFYDTSGQKILQPIGSARTNDLGEYRVFWVSPGHYYLAVTTNQNVGTVLSANGTIVGASSPNEVEHVAQPTVYYPGTVDLKSAVPIQLSSGDDLRAIDVLVPQTQRVLTIRGRVLDSATGQPPRGLNMTLLPRDTSLQRLGLNSDSSGYDSAKGTFEIRDVVPGTYWLQAQAGGIGNNGARLGTTMMLDVARDLEGLVLNLSAGIPVSGRLRVEGQALSASPTPTPRVSLRPTRPYALTSPSVLVTADGSFTLQNVFVGEYAIVVTPMPTGYFLKEARIGQVDVLGRPWVIEETSVRDSLEVVLGSNAGNIEGKVVDSRSQPAAGIQAVLVPDESRFRNELFINAVTDQEGRFALRGVAPGTYRLFAWEYVEANSFFDPEVLRRYEQQGVPVRVREGETAVLEVKIIPTLPK